MALCALVLAGACSRSPVPTLVSPGTAGTASAAVPPSVAPLGVDGLLVAADGPLQVTTPDGELVAFDDRLDPVVEVAAGSGGIVVIGRDLLAWWAPDPGAGRRAWQRLALPTDDRSERPLISLDARGGTLALATGELQGQAFDLVLIDPSNGTSRPIPVVGGLNGGPVWLEPGVVAINVIGPDQHAGFSRVDTSTGAGTDLPSFGSVLAASADGSVVALDDGRTGDVLVGAASDLTEARLAAMTRLRGRPGFGADRIALNGEGTRLAIVRRSDTAVRIEIHVLVDGRWAPGPASTAPADATVSIAWLR